MVDQTVFNLVPDNNEEEFIVDFGEVTQVETTTDFNNLENRPKYNDELMTGETNIPAVPTKVSDLENDADYQTDTQVAAAVEVETTARQNADINLQGQIDAITSASDVVDIVGTYAELQAYPTAQLKDNDVIKVIQDNTHNDAMTYYRWSTSTSTWTYIGSEGPYYTKSQADNLLLEKQDKLTAGENITITNNVISATGGGGSYTAGNAIDITGNVISADIYPADYFTAGATTTGTGANITLNNTIPAKLEDVKLYGDTEQQTYTGKNLIDFPAYSGTASGIAWTITSDTISGSGTAESNWTIPYSNYQYFESPLPPGNYVFSIPVSLSSVMQFNLREEGGTVHDYNINPGTTSIAITTTFEADRYRIAFRTDGAGTPFEVTFPNQLQLEAGSTATSYEPYVGGVPAPNPDFPQAVNVVTGEQTVNVTGKNLLDLTNGTYSANGVDAVVSNGIVTLNGTATANSFISVPVSTNYSINTGEQFTLCLNNETVNASCSLRVNSGGQYDVNGSQVNNYKTSTLDASLPLISTSITIRTQSGGSYTNYVIKPQLLKGSAVAAYEPFEGQSYTVRLGSLELCKIGTYQDYIYKSGDDWYVHKDIGKTILSSTNNWTVRTDVSVTDCTVFRDYDYVAGLFNSNAQGLSTHFKVASSYSANVIRLIDNNSYGISPVLENDTLGIVGGDDNTQKATKFKTWLSNNAVSVYYALATPTDTKITDTDLIADLDALGGATTYLDTTSFAVTATGTNLPALLNPTAYRNSADGVASRITDAPTYSDFVGTDGNTGGTHGLVPAPATTDAGKFLKADGTWDTAGGGGPTVVQATGTSTTDVMSQNAVSSTIFADPGTNEKVQIGSGANVSVQSNNMAIGYNASANGTQAIAIGSSAKARPSGTALGNSAQAGNGVSHGSCVAIGNSAYVGGTNGTAVGASSNIINSYATAIGSNARARSERSLAIGASAQVDNSPAMDYSVALGASATTTRAGEVNVGTGSQNYGYNSTPYRVIGGVHDGQDAHDAVTVGQINATIDALNTALGSSIPHIGA